MFAIIDFNNIQYKVEAGKEYDLPLFEYDEKKLTIIFDKVLLVSNEKDVLVGTPNVAGAKVSATIVGPTRGEKVRVFKFRAKKRYKRTGGQVQDLIKIKIDKITTNEK